jgi:hypothetical protein
MTVDQLRETTGQAQPPAGLPLLAEALWWQAHGDWPRAHRIVDALTTPDGMWVHAYLHRCEGDLGNAGYWYRQAHRPRSSQTLDEEWREIAGALLLAD